jgi:signal transduction histidine kinase
LGEEGSGYIAIQVLLEQLRAASGTVRAALLDSARTVIYDTNAPEHGQQVSRLDTLAHVALGRAYAGHGAVSAAYPDAGGPLCAGLAPVMDHGRVVAVLAVEARPEYRAGLGRLGRSLALTTVAIGFAIVILGLVIARLAWSAVELERRLSRAENLAAMGRLTATLAHEIKNPLAIIRGSVQRLGRLVPEAQRMADSVIEETDRLSRTVGRYLEFARPSAMEGHEGDAMDCLRATLGLLEGEIGARRVELRLVGEWPREATTSLDPESLKQVYLNLLLNALEAMPEGGRLEVAASEARGGVEVSITDSGPGFPPEVLREIGQPFVTTKAQGTGLGLFLIRRLLDAAGGELRIENEAGRGARCTVRLPRSAGSTPRSPRPRMSNGT